MAVQLCPMKSRHEYTLYKGQTPKKDIMAVKTKHNRFLNPRFWNFDISILIVD